MDMDNMYREKDRVSVDLSLMGKELTPKQLEEKECARQEFKKLVEELKKNHNGFYAKEIF